LCLLFAIGEGEIGHSNYILLSANIELGGKIEGLTGIFEAMLLIPPDAGTGCLNITV
jgi:hypothetical protein